MPKTGAQQQKGGKGANKKKKQQAYDEDEQSNRNGQGYSQGEDDDEDVSLNSESDGEYDEEDDDIHEFINDDELEESYQEDPFKKKKKKDKKKKKNKKEYAEHTDLEDDDLDLIADNLPKKKKLNKLRNLEVEEGDADEFYGRSNQRKLGVKRDRIEDEYDQDDDQDIKDEYGYDKLGNRPLKILDKGNEYDDDRRQSHALADNFMTDDIDDLFGTPQDQEIADKDIPERLQIRLKNRLNPPEDVLRREAEWIYSIIWEQNDSRDNQGGIQKTQDNYDKIFKVLKMIRIDQFDVPFITKYKVADFPEFSPEHIWKIFNLDIEYGKFEVQKKQIEDFFNQIKNFSDQNHDIAQVINQIHYVNNHRDLKDFYALVDFYKSYYQKELEEVALNNGRKLPVKRVMFVRTAREKKLDQFSRRCTISPAAFVENIDNDKLIHKPNPLTQISPKLMAREYMQDANNKQETINIIREMCVYTTVELWCHPDIRKHFKKFVKEKGTIKTVPTDKGVKELDLLHPSYRVKRVDMRIDDLTDTDLFLDILQNESLGLIICTIKVQNQQDFFDKLFEKYQSQESKLQGESKKFNEWENVRKEIQRYFTIDRLAVDNKQQNEWSRSRKEIQRIFCQDNNMISSKVEQPFIQSIIDEVKEELKEEAENYVIQQSREKYRDMIQTGYFAIRNDNPYQSNEKRADQIDDEIIPQRERITVMGAILHPIDNRNYMTTVAVVDKYGDLQCHKDFLHLIPPRTRKQRPNEQGQQMRQNQDDGEKTKHDEAVAQFKKILSKHKVDLIVVCADSLEARKLKKNLSDFAKYQIDPDNMDDDMIQKDQIDSNMNDNEALVIWGRPEIPKLFASSHYSQKLLKNHPFILKKAICLARYEQDPMNEILNLWSPIMSENQTLNLALHPMQKHINKARLMDILEEVNIQFLNKVGVDINLVIEHEHMYNQIQFLSGLGPRKSQKLIQKLKQQNSKVFERRDIIGKNILEKKCFRSSIGFMKVRVSIDKRIGDDKYRIDYLDQTRIHYFNYDKIREIAGHCIYPGEEIKGDLQKQHSAICELLKNPTKLIENFQIQNISDENAQIVAKQMIDDFMMPFKDPREDKEFYRDFNNIELKFSQKDLMYSLIDETDRTFKQGMIVSATVVRIFENKDQQQVKFLCRLENGLDAIIFENEADFFTERSDKIDVGLVVQGRVHFDKLQKQPSTRPDEFNITLKCRKKDLSSHENYLYDLGYGEMDIHEDDKKNANFQVQEEQTQIQRRAQIQKRKIQHPRFQNISSTVAISNLKREDNGEFYFRPSSKGTDNLTLTWKFYESNIVHIDISEFDKAIGANIGSKLKISDEYYENLQEIVERYITPCNRSIREVTQHPKFLPCNKIEQVQAELEKEKAEVASKIPYKFVMLDDYPQYVILCYIPNKSLVREYIKVKPRGYHFHGQYHYPFVSLINWFKQEFGSSKYQTFHRRTASPQKIGAMTARNQQMMNQSKSRLDNIYGQTTGGMQIDQVNNNERETNFGGANWGLGGQGMNDSGPVKHEDHGGFSSKPKSSGFGRGQRATPGGGSSTRKGPGGMGGGGGDWANNDDRRSPHNRGGSNSPSGVGGWGGGRHESSNPGTNIKNERERGGQPGGWGGGGGGGSERDQIPGGGPSGAWSNRGGGGGGMDSSMAPRSERKRNCYNCGEENHMARDCNNPPSAGGSKFKGAGRGRGGGGGGMDSSRGPMKCYNCQGEGHMARNCTEPRKERPPRNDNDGAPYKKRRMDDNGSNFGQKDLESNWQNNNAGGGNNWNDNNNGGYGNDDAFGGGQQTAGGGGGGDDWGNDAKTGGFNNSQDVGGNQNQTAGGGGGGGGGWGDNSNPPTQNDNSGWM